MDFYEQLVQIYLTVFEHCFVLPQPPIKLSETEEPVDLFLGGTRWEKYPDFLALDFSKGRIYIIEVTKSLDQGAVRDKVKGYDQRSRDRIRKWIQKSHPGALQVCGGGIDLRFYVRNQEVADKLQRDHQDVEFRSLETVFEAVKDKMP